MSPAERIRKPSARDKRKATDLIRDMLADINLMASAVQTCVCEVGLTPYPNMQREYLKPME